MPIPDARPTLYRGTLMRSRLEADYAAELDRRGVDWTYEPICFASSDGQWLPDFKARGEYVEVKSASLIDDRLADLSCLHIAAGVARRMRIAWDSEPGAKLHLTFWRYGGPSALRLVGRQGKPWRAVAENGPVGWLCDECLPQGTTYWSAMRARAAAHDEHLARRTELP